MRQTANMLRILSGLLFIFSGFVKAVDPVGTQIKFEDYFNAMGMDFLEPAALLFSFVLNAAEFILGVMLVLNLFGKIALWGALSFMFLFTPLTLWLAIANPVSDCGCFGDAVELTNWETFWKNIILLGFLLFTLFFGDKHGSLNTKTSVALVLLTTIVIFGFQTYNLRHLPLIDFRPFEVGADIKERTEIPKDAPKDVYETKLYYINNNSGERKEFTIENSPYDDTENWTFDTTINKLVSKGYEPPISDFFISTEAGDNITDAILSDENYSLILVSPEFGKAKPGRLHEVERISDFCETNGINFYIFTGSGGKERAAFKQEYEYSGQLCTADKTMLKTIARSNPAWVLIKDGVIIDKWHFRDLPKNEELKEIIN
jgi:uncharacterized membrane protein YphA (DoxX/SURF4 family)